MKQVMIFAGTTEGRQLADWCQENRIPVCVSVATEYGEEVLKEAELRTEILTGYMDREQMKACLTERESALVIDATHPYAVVVTETIKEVCQELSLKCLRLLRPETLLEDVNQELGKTEGNGLQELCEKELPTPVYVSSAKEAKAFLDRTEGNILLTTGSKELKTLVDEGNCGRVYPRVLPSLESIRLCMDQNIPMKQIVAMQGPFSAEINAAILNQYACRYLVTKESGAAGGFAEKLQACQRTGSIPVIIGRPKEEQGLSLVQVQEAIGALYGVKPVQEISIVGIGMGTAGTLTAEGKAAILAADGLAGGARMLALAEEVRGARKTRRRAEAEAKKTIKQKYAEEKTAEKKTAENELAAYDPRVICEWILKHKEYRKIAVLMSGDVGFYSGTARLAKELEVLEQVQVQVISGISSVTYFAGRVGLSWEDMKLCSIHGRRANLLWEIQTNQKVFSLIGKGAEVKALCQRLTDCGMGNVRLYVGENLGYEQECIRSGTAAELGLEDSFSDLSVIIAVNDRYDLAAFHLGIPESEFIRDQVPMTKEEIRCISLAKLRPDRDGVIYDIGAGTGSVSVELALAAAKGVVYAIERKPLAVELLKKNREKFGLNNLEIVEGLAPEVLQPLPAPTQAFIGGSGGNLKEIVELLIRKNPKVRIVVNAIALETIAEVTELAKNMKSELLFVSVAKAKEIGAYHMMMGQNPVLIGVLEAK